MKVAPPRFPHRSWAWPSGGLDLLLRAVLCADDQVAMAAARQWFARQDIDAASFAEHRLLMAVAARFGHALADLPDYPRLAGLQRMLWTKARMALREVLPPLALIAAAGIPVVMLKGAARLVLNPAEQKSRISHDTDILVPQGNLAAALQHLTAHGWQPSTGESGLALGARLASTRAVNLFCGHFGDIDLHQWGYGPGPNHAAAEADLWAQAQAGRFFQVPVLVPSAEHRIALALASSALDAHAHSDWLVDCARVLTQERVDPARLVDVLAQADQLPQAAVALSYLGEGLGLSVPGLAEIRSRAGGSGRVRRLATLLEMKPRADWSPVSRMARGLAKQLRKRAEPRDGATPQMRATWLKGRIGRLPARWAGAAPIPMQAPIPLGQVVRGAYHIDLSIIVDLPGVRRRLEFELNQDDAHVTRLRARDLLKRRGRYRLRFSGRVTIGQDGQLWLQSRPSKAQRGAEQPEIDRYEAVPMRLCAVSIRRLGGQDDGAR